ncbi:bifunctional lysylphosphatidylglycerol synthetase/lysine--tRNA ligase LysX [Labedella endophytica]|nr:bifunctional lysylphosphatidylglycerol synthetase/lysine--tRNA ligase LysX [Labedella endophytica]
MTVTQERDTHSPEDRTPDPIGSTSQRPTRASRETVARRRRTRRRSDAGAWTARVPLWTGRLLQTVSVTLLLVVFSNIVFPDGVYWAANYFALFGLSPEPFLFNAVLLFIVGSAAKRRLRGAVLFLVVFELPTILLPLVDLVAAQHGGPSLADLGPNDLIASGVATAFVLLLVCARKEFFARREPASVAGALAIFAGGVAIAVLVGGVVSELVPGAGGSPTDVWWRSLHAATGIYPGDWLFDGSDVPLSPELQVAVTSISAVGLLLALAFLLRSARSRRLMSEEEELDLRRILHAGSGDDSLAYFATRRDKSIVFTADRRAAVSYRVVGRTALASGDPLGPESEWDAAITQWLETVQRYGWRPAVVAASERAAGYFARHGMRGMVLGDEAVLNLTDARADALLRSPQIESVRRRLRRDGYRARFRRQGELDPGELAEVAALTDEWRRGGEERGFSMALSRVADPTDAQSLVATAHDASGTTVAALVFVPWNHDGLSLDVMRRSPAAANGATEFLVSELVAQAASLGVTRVSLNFAVFRDLLVRGARVGAGPLLKAKRALLLLLSRHWQLESLRRANEKYEPEWRSRFILWSRGTTFGATMVAVARAEGFATGRGSRSFTERMERSDAFGAEVIALGDEWARSRLALMDRRILNPRAERALALRGSGVDPFPVAVPRTTSLVEVRALATTGASAAGGASVSVTGRVVARRRHGGITFLDLNEEHERLQVIAEKASTDGYAALARVDLGDLVSVTGRPARSLTGEPSIAADGWILAAKSLSQPPNARTGLRDPEAQVRLRHVHLATSRSATETLIARSRAVRALRDGLLAEDYLEVETPILQRTNGGANARPFRTHINAYRRDLTLRIAPELALKRLVVAGLPRVFEIGRNFRNEGADASHNPEFTAMEAYLAYADYTEMLHLAERLIRGMAAAVSGGPTLVSPDGERVDVSGEWPVITVCDALSQMIGMPITIDLPADILRDVCAAYGVTSSATDGSGALIERLYEELVESRTTNPTFYIDFPSETSPLARPHRDTPGLAERWDLVAFGMELGTAYTELNDPLEQRRRLTEQSLAAAAGDPEAMELDEDFLQALEFGMPPTGGLGLGVDRIVMAATGASIRQTLTFPFVR